MKIITSTFSLLLLFGCSESPNETSNSNNKETPSIENAKAEEISETQIKGYPEKQEIIETKVITKNGKKVTIQKKVDPISGKTELIEVAPDASTEKIEEPKATETKMIKVDFSQVYGQILSNFVSSSGNVNYSAIKTNRQMLSQATQHFEENLPEASWSKNEKLAYWINAYNLYTIELVVDNYPVKSIKDIAGGKPWDKKFIKLDGKTLSLNDIENGIIRKDFNEPRIHFAVNCASISCPKLLNNAYTSGNLNSLLESQTKRFINDNSMNSITASKAEISNIFDWYKVDFGNIITFLNKYVDTEIESSVKISYKEYNWNLNK